MADATPDLGRWHIPVILATFYRGVPSAMIVMVINFAAPRLHYWCRDAILEDEGTEGPAINASACWLHVNGSRVRCEAWEFDHDTFTSTIVEDESTKKGFNFVNLLKSPKLRRFTMVFFITSFAHRLRYFHLTYSSALLSGDLFVNYAIVHVMELPGKLLLGALAVKFLWRRPTLAGCFIVAAAALLGSLAVTHGECAFTSLSAKGDRFSCPAASFRLLFFPLLGRTVVTATMNH
ncbi:hypothetical protein V5799_016199 [Amblyomma americanum]|uniref:Organic anion transporter n=1 Tax=Amblyomma americanum TaxID=6943 RepID=A0AAQ4F5T0_AMBAM